jgi:hypothetical protein
MVKASTLPLFRGSMRLDTSRSLPKSHYWGSMLSQKISRTAQSGNSEGDYPFPTEG